MQSDSESRNWFNSASDNEQGFPYIWKKVMIQTMLLGQHWKEENVQASPSSSTSNGMYRQDWQRMDSVRLPSGHSVRVIKSWCSLLWFCIRQVGPRGYFLRSVHVLWLFQIENLIREVDHYELKVSAVKMLHCSRSTDVYKMETNLESIASYIVFSPWF